MNARERVQSMAEAAGGWEFVPCGWNDEFRRGNRRVVVRYRDDGAIVSAVLRDFSDGTTVGTRLDSVGLRTYGKFHIVSRWFVGLCGEAARE